MKIQVEVLWILTQCSYVVGYRRFGVPCCVNMEVECLPETSVSYHITARHHNDRDLSVQFVCGRSNAELTAFWGSGGPTAGISLRAS